MFKKAATQQSRTNYTAYTRIIMGARQCWLRCGYLVDTRRLSPSLPHSPAGMPKGCVGSALTIIMPLRGEHERWEPEMVTA